jgi:tryptophan synthase alpha chain|tara:strand:- start:1843 stop:2622 length:780 start_codon:yes stop_codon:yes gene_type:complete
MNNLDKLPSKNILSLFMTCGFPSLNQSKSVFKTIQKNNPDIIEFGLPFSDPMADGLVIQEANKLALKKGLTTNQSINLIKSVSKNKGKTSYVIMCYINTIMKYGVSKFIKSIKGTVDGLIIVDLPFEEEKDIRKKLENNGIYLIKLISPMTDSRRAKKLLHNSKGFIYYISSTGITGSNKLNYKEINQNIKMIKKHSSTPVLVGFGVKSRQDAQSLKNKTLTNGVIIGSALIQMYFDLRMNFNNYIKSLDNYIKSVNGK